MGGSPRIQQPIVQPTPRKEDRAVQDAVADAVRRRSRGRGYRSTVLSKDFLDTQSAALQDTLGA